MKTVKAFREFIVEKAIYEKLSKDESKILPLLIEASRQISIIYQDQEKGADKYPGASFYPADVSDKKISQAASKNPEILSPYTVIEKHNNSLNVVPYHIKYKVPLQKISKLLEQASLTVKDQALASYLKTASESLLSGDYKKMDIAWLKTQDSTLQFLIGPYERYLDKRFFIKMAYQSFVGIKDPYYTQKAKEISDVLFTTTGDKPHRYTAPIQTQICTIHNIIFAGFPARALVSTGHIPSNDQTIRESGSRLMGYLSSMNYKFDHLLYPTFNLIFEKRFQESYSEELLRRGNYYLMLVYGLARQLHRYEGARERLKELFPVIDEANSFISGIQHSKHLILKGVIDQKDLEAMIIMHICWSFSEWVFAKTSQVRSDYLQGDTLALNFYFQNQALRQSEGISWPNFSKIFFVIESLSTIFVHFLSEGSYQEVHSFLKSNLSYEIFKAFDTKLSRIKPLDT